MNYKLLKKFRVVFSLITLIIFTLIFVDIKHLIPEEFIQAALFFQFVPSVIKIFEVFTIAGLGFLLVMLLNLLFGRVYCSFLCPLGILQDVLSYLSLKFRKKKRYKYTYSKPHSILRYSLLGVSIISALSGAMLIINLLDPYSIFGRLANSWAKPVVVGGNNLISNTLAKFDNYAVFPYDFAHFDIITFGISGIVLIALLVMATKHGRLYCNTVCPVGTLLGLLSKKSLFKIQFVEENCTSCSLCQKSCKSECIDYKEFSVDHSRCVDCFNCVSACKDNALVFAPVRAKKTGEGNPKTDESKRAFIAKSISFLLGFTFIGKHLFGQSVPQPEKDTTIPEEKNFPVTPPGSHSITHFTDKCTACHLCVSACPTQVLQPSWFQYGIFGLMQPHMDYHAGFCNFECKVCGDICPNGAILPMELETKKQTQLGVAQFIKESCVVYTDETDCGACSEHCPTKAVKMVPYKGSLTIPEMEQEICIGCGACEYACPTRPYRAIYVDGNDVQILAEKPKVEEQEVEVLDDFPF